MNKTAAISLLAVGALVTAVVVGELTKSDAVDPRDAGVITKTVSPDPVDIPPIDPATKAQTPTPVSSLTPEKKMEVHAVVDGAALVPVLYQSDGGVTKLDAFPCSWRPKGVKPTDCLRRTPKDLSGKTNVDPGDENTIPPGEGVGPGCAPRPCRIFAGQKTP